MDLTGFKLGENSDDIVLESRHDNVAAALALIGQARSSIDIFTRDLEPRVLDNSEFSDALKNFALTSPHTKIRILVNEPDMAVKDGHRLIHLARRLTSYFEIRKTHADYAMNPAAFLIADERGILLRSVATYYAGIANFNAPLKANELLRFFDDAWIHSRQYTEFRRLYI